MLSEILTQNAIAISGLMGAVWLLSLVAKDASLVDLFWGLGFVLVAWVSFAAQRADERDWLPPLLVTVWGVRLSGYLAWRNLGHGEDRRYREMRDKHGRWFGLVSLVTVFALQGTVMWVVSLPIQAAARIPGTDPAWIVSGVALWMVGLAFESIGDWQLARFKSNPDHAGQVCDRGLWRYTRHPNYFGDFLVWWGFYALSVGYGAPYWTAVGAVVMSVFLMFISGAVLLEKSLRDSKPAYAEYARRTSAFFPARPRS